MNRNNLKGRNILGYNAISFLKYLPCFFMLVIEFAGTKACIIRIVICTVMKIRRPGCVTHAFTQVRITQQVPKAGECRFHHKMQKCHNLH